MNHSISNLYPSYIDKNEISISTPTSNPPIFNYTSFGKILSIDNIGQIIDEGLKNNTTITSKKLVAEEILKMLMDQISSLKMLTYYTHYIIVFYLFSRSQRLFSRPVRIIL